jgi:hypothetical protein
MKGFVMVREWNEGPQFLTPKGGWSTKVENAIVTPTEERAQELLRNRPAFIRNVELYVNPEAHHV